MSASGAPSRPAAPASLRFVGAFDALSAADRRALTTRSLGADDSVARSAAAIVAHVRARGDAALIELGKRFDGVELGALEVPRSAVQSALELLDPAVRGAMERAARNIETVHRAFLPAAVESEPEPGIVVGRRPDPLSRVGVYAPGGRAAYPSSALMGAIPARVAGVSEIVLCSPPDSSGLPGVHVLAAAALARVDRVFAIGGAGAIAAMAIGTESVPRVDRIVGPGNAYVAAAKLLLAGTGAVVIDSPAGPSELLIVADAAADADGVAIEMIAQAEHDPDACVVAACVGPEVAGAVRAALEAACDRASRRSVVAAALAGQGGVLSFDTLAAAIAFANEYAPEHLLLAIERPEQYLTRIRNAGTVFLGETSSVAFGDYMTGANHVLPTAGTARSYSGLSTLDFIRWTTYQRVDRKASGRLAGDTAAFASVEGLPGHAAAASRFDGRDSETESLVTPVFESNRPPSARTRPSPARSESRVQSIERYDPDRSPVAVDLSDNTNRWGGPPAAAREIQRALSGEAPRYPDAYSSTLKQAIANYVGVSPSSIVTGCGSDDVLDAAIRAFGEPGDRLAFIDPSFGMIPVFARLNGLMPVPVPLDAAYAVDVDALVASDAAMTYLCSPNNPTGTLIPRATIEAVLTRTRGMVIVDEAYAEFSGASVSRLVAQHQRLVVVRTMSKAFGLAGLRVGYAIAAPDIVIAIEKSRGPFKVSAIAERAAAAALTEDLDWMRAHAKLAVENRDRFVAALRACGHDVIPSSASFVLVPMRDPSNIARAMRSHGVAVRPFEALPQVSPALRATGGGALRISVGPWTEMEAALAALEASCA